MVLAQGKVQHIGHFKNTAARPPHSLPRTYGGLAGTELLNCKIVQSGFHMSAMTNALPFLFTGDTCHSPQMHASIHPAMFPTRLLLGSCLASLQQFHSTTQIAIANSAAAASDAYGSAAEAFSQ